MQGISCPMNFVTWNTFTFKRHWFVQQRVKTLQGLHMPFSMSLENKTIHPPFRALGSTVKVPSVVAKHTSTTTSSWMSDFFSSLYALLQHAYWDLSVFWFYESIKSIGSFCPSRIRTSSACTTMNGSCTNGCSWGTLSAWNLDCPSFCSHLD